MSVTLTAAQRDALAAREKAAQVVADDVFTICWTSGTEAQPKGVPRSHNEWLVVAPSIIEVSSAPKQTGQAKALELLPSTIAAAIVKARLVIRQIDVFIAASLSCGGTMNRR